VRSAKERFSVKRPRGVGIDIICASRIPFL
jgi:hypothetical protein